MDEARAAAAASSDAVVIAWSARRVEVEDDEAALADDARA